MRKTAGPKHKIWERGQKNSVPKSVTYHKVNQHSVGRREEKGIEMEIYNQGMVKTELSNKWQETGSCPYGDHFQFAHGIAKLRPVIRHPRYKTQVCRVVLAGEACPYGHSCHFGHSLTEQEQLLLSP
ncbi:CONSTANS-like zinc finger protein [Hibiscus syriacus]|uniref:CONSTANS-like zinc finger protein n=1 Tax=Hibiscus syriacus TaxID=106335 RepID=A0A6A2XVM1_HIBSY|nr:CONSTANS-like zinc finger protein [Hibiscus syriacus]